MVPLADARPPFAGSAFPAAAGAEDHRVVRGKVMKRIVLGLLLAPVLLLVIQGVTGAVVLPSRPMPEGGGGWVLLYALITAWVLTGLAFTVGAGAWGKAALLFLVAAGIPANNLVEAFFFPLEIPREHLPPLFIHTFVWGGLLAFVLARLAGSGASRPAVSGEGRSVAAWAWRFAAADLSYVVLYTVAGLLVWPYVSHFYAGRALPDPGTILAMQVARGLVFCGIAYALMRFLAVRPVIGALIVGATLSLVGGVAPLLMPNPYMPTSIRLPHMVEVGVSNLLFGVVAAWLLRPRGAMVSSAEAEGLHGALTAR
jgi:hypothetical protein